MHEAGRLPDDTVVVDGDVQPRLPHRDGPRGITVVETAVGDRYVLEAMKDGGFSLGGEQSGHVIMLEHATTGDGLLTGLHLLARVAATGQAAGRAGRGDGPAAAGADQRAAGVDRTAVSAGAAAAGGGRGGRGRAGRHRPGAAAPERDRAGGPGDGRGDREAQAERSPRGWPTSSGPSSPSSRPCVRPGFPGSESETVCRRHNRSPILCKRGVRYRVGKVGATSLVSGGRPAHCGRTVGTGGGMRGRPDSAHAVAAVCVAVALVMTVLVDTPPSSARGAAAAALQGASPEPGLALAAAAGAATGRRTDVHGDAQEEEEAERHLLDPASGREPRSDLLSSRRTASSRGGAAARSSTGSASCSSRRRLCTAAQRAPAWPPSRTAPGCGVAPSRRTPRWLRVRALDLHGRRRAGAAETAGHPPPQVPEPAVPAGTRHGVPGHRARRSPRSCRTGGPRAPWCCCPAASWPSECPACSSSTASARACRST